MPATKPSTPKSSQMLHDQKENASADPHSTTGLPSNLPLLTNATPDLLTKTEMETNVVSVTSGEGKLALSSPVEASPAKPALESSCALAGSPELSPATSCTASAAESLVCTGPDFVRKLEATPFGGSQLNTDFPMTLSFQGVSVTLENNSLWKQFHEYGTEMILTKQGRRMFPYCRYRLSGLEPTKQYSLVLSIVPSDNLKYRYNSQRWEVSGLAEHKNNSLIRAFCHHISPRRGSAWMTGTVSFFKLKLTNNPTDEDGHIILNSFHRYIPRLHVIPLPEGVCPTPDQPILIGPNCLTFTFPQTEFMGVTTYQNFSITKLKIDHNPFAKAFREDGNNSRLLRLNKSTPELDPVEPQDGQEALIPDVLTNIKEEPLDSCCEKAHVDPVTSPIHTRLVLKPIMSTKSSTNELYVPCLRGNHTLGELVLVEENEKDSVEMKDAHRVSAAGGTAPMASSTPEASLARSSPRYRKKRRGVNSGWENSRESERKDLASSPEESHTLPLTLGMRPELDDVDGLVFASFDSKEALEVQNDNKYAINTSPTSPVSTVTNIKTDLTIDHETDAEKMVRFEACILQELPGLKHRQVIHPVLRQVGLKLSSVDPTQSIDLQYLGVPLPIPAPVLQEHQTTTTHKSLSFFSRTGKTSDMTKLKGWKNKLVRNTAATSSNSDGSAKNLSAFCSNMLDEYLESEGQIICERAAAFSTRPEDPVVYQLPAKSSSYVRTLDSVLKQRNFADKDQVAASRPCPLPYKVQGSQTKQGRIQTAQSCWSDNTGSVPQGSLAHQPGFSQSHVMLSKHSIKFMYKMTPIEKGAINKGLNRAQLTPERVETALSVLLTKEMQADSIPKVSLLPKDKTQGPECGGEFCKLGCICTSLMGLEKAPLHCRRPECMFGCNCSKRKIMMKASPGEAEPQIQSVYSVTNIEHTVQPQSGSFVNKLWKRSMVEKDPEPLHSPVILTARSVTPVFVLRNSQIPEEEKDPVYKYFESMMTCARVRGFNAKPPQVSNLPGIFNIATSTVKGKKTVDDSPKTYFRTLNNHIKEVKTTEVPEFKGAKVRHQIEIQSVCEWDFDRKKVIETLCRRMSQGKLTQLFKIGPYLIRPLAKISIEKPSGSVITYRVCISKPTSADEDGLDFVEEEEEEEEDMIACDEADRPVKKVLITPFLSRVQLAGTLRAKPKPVGTQATGLVQVNGKPYNQARLLLGSMGSLHPANRLAGYITGRLRVPSCISQKVSRKIGLTEQVKDELPVKVAGKVIPPTVATQKTVDLMAVTQSPVQTHQPNLQISAPTTTESQISQTPSSLNSHLTAAPERNLDGNFQGCSSPSFSLAVCPTLKTPSFVGQSGTYRFRICPPAQQSSVGPSQQGIVLPGGFTLIQLSKQGGSGAPPMSDNTENLISSNKVLLQEGTLSGTPVRAEVEGDNWAYLGDRTDGSISQESNEDFNFEGLSSASFDMDEDLIEGFVDVEALEEEENTSQITASPKSKADSVREPCSLQELRRKNHNVVERLRRSEQRGLFDKLVDLFNVDPKTPRLHLLTMAVNEIKELENTASFLVNQTKTLIRLRTKYLKDLSQLTGKSEREIKSRLLQLCNNQKASEKNCPPSFSSLLEPKAAPLQPPHTSSCNAAPTTPQLEQNLLSAPSHSTDAHVNFVLQTVAAEAQSHVRPAAPSYSQLQQSKADEAAAPTVFTMMNSQNESEHQGPALVVKKESPDQKPLVAFVPKAHQNVTLPLIRSKTGRIILPSSLKPVGQGYYTITFLSPQQKDQGDDDKPHEEESSKKEGNNPSKMDSPANNGCEASHPSFPGTASKGPSVAGDAENCPAKVMKKNESPSAGEKPRRGRGRPPKRRHVPVPGKRGRGRPRKTTNAVLNDCDPEDSSDDGATWHPRMCSSSDANSKCTPVRSTRLSDRNSRRPLTRGALGKDFPSAKKRSWIDVERELEVDNIQE